MRPCVVGEAAHHAGATDSPVTPQERRRSEGWFHARFVLQRGPAFHDVGTTIVQAVAVPSTEPACGAAAASTAPFARSPLDARSPLPYASDPARVVGMPVPVERASRHARNCRLSELERLKARIDKLERTLSELSARIEATACNRPAQQGQPPQAGSGG